MKPGLASGWRHPYNPTYPAGEFLAFDTEAPNNTQLTASTSSNGPAAATALRIIQAKMPTTLQCSGIVAISGSLWAQSSAGVSGKVSDQTGASLPGAIVSVKNTETGVTRVVATDEAGNFRALALPVGPQEIRVEKTGFKAAVRTGIDVAVGRSKTAPLCLNE